MKSTFSFRKKHVEAEDTSLNITAMADIFTIILVFLLKSYATSALNIAPAMGLTLPQAQAAQNNVEALKIQILENSILVEDQAVVTLNGFSFAKGDLLQNGSSRQLTESLKRERAKQLAIAKSNSDVKVDPKILVIADEKVPYNTIKTVLASAAVHGFTDFKLAVVLPE